MMCPVLTLAIGDGRDMGYVWSARPTTSISRWGSCTSSVARPAGMDVADVSVRTSDDFTECAVALVYCIDPGGEECRIACPGLFWLQHHRRPRRDAFRADPHHR